VYLSQKMNELNVTCNIQTKNVKANVHSDKKSETTFLSILFIDWNFLLLKYSSMYNIHRPEINFLGWTTFV